MISACQSFFEQLFHIGAFKTREHSPTGQGFKLKLHESHPDAPLSPFYLDLRLLRSCPEIAHQGIVTFFGGVIREYAVAALADVPTAVTPLVAQLSYALSLPMISPQISKAHGMQSGIVGLYQPEQNVLVIDDVLTTGTSILAAIQILRDHGLRIRDALVVIDREQGGIQQLEKAGVKTRAICTISELLILYLTRSLIDEKLYNEIQDYLATQR